jgi:phosphatidylethanolamine-binding protein (PEBP) family uncharacterized protein
MRAIGRLLRPVRASESASPLADPKLAAAKSITVTSPSFGDGESIPRLHAGPGVGENISPGLQWSDVPAEARHLVVLMDDVDVPLPKPLVHTIAVIEPDRTSLGEGEFVSGSAGVRIIATRLSRDGYSGPRPIPGHGPHRYRFHVLAVGSRVPDDVASGKGLMQVIAGQVIARGTLTGTYER